MIIRIKKGALHENQEKNNKKKKNNDVKRTGWASTSFFRLRMLSDQVEIVIVPANDSALLPQKKKIFSLFFPFLL